MKSLRYYIDLVEEEEFTFSPEQEKFLGNADRQDPHILKRMPGPKPPISYFKNPEDQETAKKLNFGQQNVNAVTQAFGGKPGEPEKFARSLQTQVASTDSTSVAPPVAPPVAEPVSTTGAVIPGKITAITAPPTDSAALDPARNPDSNTNIQGGPQGPPGRVPPKPAKKLLPVDEKLKPIQEKLKAMGYDLGPTGVDGRLGKYTKQAIDDFNSGKPPGKSKGPGPSGPTPPGPSEPATASAAKGPNGETIVKNAKGETGYIRQQGKSKTFIPYTPPTPAAPAAAPTPAANPPAAPTPVSGTAKGPNGETIVKDPKTGQMGYWARSGRSTTFVPMKLDPAALERLEKELGLTNTKSENFNKLTPVGQIQKIRQLVDEAQGRDALGANIEVPDTIPKKTSTLAGGTGQAPIMNTDVRALGPATEKATATTGTAGKAWGAVKSSPVGKFMGRHLPGASMAFGAQDAYSRGKEGDWVGAGIAAASTAASTVPVYGTAASIGLDLVNVARDWAAGKYDDPDQQREQDWSSVDPYVKDPELFKSLPPETQVRLNKIIQKAAEVAATEKK